jgi:TonB family protein
MKNRIAFALLVLLSFLTLVSIPTPAQDASVEIRKVVVKVDPQYPSLARNLNIQGTVRADVLVAPNGKVKSIELKGGHPLLGQAAMNALLQWKWEPAAHETHETVQLIFKP